jgi:hypothetical protein
LQNFPLLLIHVNIRVWTSTMSATVPTYGAETAALGCLGYCQVASELRRFRLERLVYLAQPDAQDDNFFFLMDLWRFLLFDHTRISPMYIDYGGALFMDLWRSWLCTHCPFPVRRHASHSTSRIPSSHIPEPSR